jgi:Fic family protein
MVENALDYFISGKNRYHTLIELKKIFDAIDETANKQLKRKKK